MAIIYPVAPKELIVAFGNKRSYETQLITQRFKGGVDERSAGMSPNPVTDNWSLTAEIKGLTRYQAVENFIASRNGEPFRFDWNGDNVVTNELYRIESHNWTWSGYYHWQLSVELKGVHRP